MRCFLSCTFSRPLMPAILLTLSLLVSCNAFAVNEFRGKPPLAGLQIGMTLDEAKAALPQLKIVSGTTAQTSAGALVVLRYLGILEEENIEKAVATFTSDLSERRIFRLVETVHYNSEDAFLRWFDSALENFGEPDQMHCIDANGGNRCDIPLDFLLLSWGDLKVNGPRFFIDHARSGNYISVRVLRESENLIAVETIYNNELLYQTDRDSIGKTIGRN